MNSFTLHIDNIFLTPGFGMSEAPCITTTPMNGIKAGSCGILPSNTEAKIINSDLGKPLGPDQVGELCVRGPQVMVY